MRVRSKNGWGVVSKHVAANPEISPQAKGLYLLLTTHADAKKRTCWPSVETLATSMGCSPRTVKTLLAELIAKGVIERANRGGSKSGRTALTRLLDFIVVTDD